MREVKFRALRVYDNKWKYGNLVELKDGEHVILEKNDIERDGHHVMLDMDDMPTWFNEETIGQYTGLKDKNGKEIYEGDILKDGNSEAYVVEWQPYSASWELQNRKHHYLFHNIDVSTMEVIGNIFESQAFL